MLEWIERESITMVFYWSVLWNFWWSDLLLNSSVLHQSRRNEYVIIIIRIAAIVKENVATILNPVPNNKCAYAVLHVRGICWQTARQNTVSLENRLKSGPLSVVEHASIPSMYLSKRSWSKRFRADTGASRLRKFSSSNRKPIQRFLFPTRFFLIQRWMLHAQR